MERELEAHLVVALAGTSMRDIGGAFGKCDLDLTLGDDRPGERRSEEVVVLVSSTGAQSREDVVAHELRAQIFDERLGRPDGRALLLAAASRSSPCPTSASIAITSQS